MNRTSAHQALCAGIGGASVAFMPQTALGMTLDGIPVQLLGMPFAPVLAGILGGAAVGGIVYRVAAKIAEMIGARKLRADADEPHVALDAAPRRGAQAPRAASRYKPRHMSLQDFEKSGVIRVVAADAYAASVSEPAEPLAEQPTGQLAEQPAEQAVEQPADQRPSAPKHLKSVILERFGASMMEGVPVIQRADGSVGDVGTAWWTLGVGDKPIISDSGFADERPIDAFLHDKNRLTPQAITHRVAQIDEGLYPEMRTSDDLDRSDTWTSALEALDEQLGEAPSPAYALGTLSDREGVPAAIDASGSLDEDTGFIPFRVPAGHPEVVDTASYINHLIADEFSRSSSPSIRMSTSSRLRVIEGGTHNLKVRESASASKTGTNAYVGKHFASVAAQA